MALKFWLDRILLVLTCNAIDPELAMSYANMSSLERHVLWERFDSRPVKKHVAKWLAAFELFVGDAARAICSHSQVMKLNLPACPATCTTPMPPKLLDHRAMPGQEPELHGFARMVGNGAGDPSLADRGWGVTPQNVGNEKQFHWYQCMLLRNDLYVLLCHFNIKRPGD
jgi:hypothetical protein